ncbi:MAG: hypothetical protein ACXVO9_06945 [Bacteroidia bacterium]
MINFERLFSGGDLRTLGRSNSVIAQIKNQKEFDALFQYLFHEDRLVIMRAADTIEKISERNPHYLVKHKKRILALCKTAVNKELQWHLAQIVSRLNLNHEELGRVWGILTKWALDRTNSRIVRVNSMQALFDLKGQDKRLLKDFALTLRELEKENIPSLKARINILRK